MLRNEDCQDCDNYLSCKTVCNMRSVPKGKLMVVGDYPSQSDDENGSIMASYREQLLFNVLHKVVKAEPDEIYKTYAVKCRPQGGRKPDKDEIEACKKYLQKEIAELRPKAILAVGDMAMYALTGLEGITKHRGKQIKVTLNEDGLDLFEPVETVVVPCFAPGYVAQNDSQLKNFANDINKAWQIASGVYIEERMTKVVHVKTLKEVSKCIQYIKQTGICCFDYETVKLDDKLNTYDPKFKATLLSLSFQPGSAYAIPLFHKDSPFTVEETLSILDTFFEEVLENPNIEKIAHNLAFEKHVSWRYGCRGLRGRCHDTMLMHHSWKEYERHGLKEIVPEFWPELEGWEDEVAKHGWDNCPLPILSEYGGVDTDATMRLKILLEKYLLEDERIYTVYRNLQMSANKTLVKAEHTGMLINKVGLLSSINRCEQLVDAQDVKLRRIDIVQRFEKIQRIAENQKRIDELEANKSKNGMYKKDGEKSKRLINIETEIKQIKSGILDMYDGINFSSVPQLAALLYTKEGFGYKKPWDKKKKEEADLTGKEYLMEFNDYSGFIEELLIYRSVKKTLGTYLQGVYDRLDKNCRIHTSFLQHGTESMRLSSRNPNLQNLPNLAKLTSEIAIEATGLVKKSFIAPEGHYLVQIDYSQAELRIIADYAQEKNMIDAYNAGIDLHAKYAAKMLSLSLEEFYKLDAKMQKQWRTRAKAGNFGLIYGMSAEGLVAYAKENYNVKLTLIEAQKMRNDFFEMYPRLLDYHADMIAKAQKFGYVRTLLGSKRHTPDIAHSNEFIRSLDERVAINSPIQGTAGQFTIFALHLLDLRLDPSVKIVNTVHDSIILYVPKEIMEKTMRMAKYTCENLPVEKYFGKSLKSVGMVVDIEYTDTNWKELKEYKLPEQLTA